MHTRLIAIGLIPAVCLAAGAASAGELEIGAYGGWNGSNNSTINHSQGSGSTFENVRWDGESFKSPLYYGVRTTFWPGSIENWGVMLDFTHAKVVANPADVPTLSLMEFTDGLNLLTLNAVHRWEMARFTPYVGVGAGINVPHVEFQAAGARTFRYDFGGPTVQAEAGLQVRVTDRFSLFGAYKVNYSWIDVDLVGGGSLDTEILTHQALFGFSLHFGSM